MRWEAVVTTAPGRKWATLRGTIESLELAGFDDVLVSSDPTPAEDTSGCGCILRHRSTGGAKPVGPWPHLLDIVRHALVWKDWERLLIVQDDVQLAFGLRPWLDDWMALESHNVGLHSLWLPGWHAMETLRGEHLHDSITGLSWWRLPCEDLPKRAYGALAVVFTQRAARLLSESAPLSSGMSKADLRLGQWCKANSLAWLYPTRSLCQHTGQDNSTLDTGRRYSTYRTAVNPMLDCRIPQC